VAASLLTLYQGRLSVQDNQAALAIAHAGDLGGAVTRTAVPSLKGEVCGDLLGRALDDSVGAGGSWGKASSWGESGPGGGERVLHRGFPDTYS
jgi:hypothetical protein